MPDEVPDHPPAPYSDERLVFCTDHSGNDVVIRPRRFLASVPRSGIGEVNRAVNAIKAEIADRESDSDIETLVIEGEPVRGDWRRFELTDAGADLDVIRLVRGLRERGIPAQPSHVYFMSSRARRFDASLNPNLFAPNLFAPNLFAPNLFAPNLFAPNLFAGGSGACGCCRRGLSTGEERPVPAHGARPADERDDAAEPATASSVEIHIVDVASPQPDGEVTGELLRDGANITAADLTSSFQRAVDVNGDRWLDPVAGHGDFIKSVIEIESGFSSTLWQAADPLGDIDDEHLVVALKAVVAGSDARKTRILNLSLSGYTEDDRPSTPVADQIRAMIEAGWLIVASAGNNASCRLAWPAALPGVIAVGAWNRCCGPAWFSNYGPWLDASASGVDVVARFPQLVDNELTLTLAIENGTTLTAAEISGRAVTWSGTSFAAPLVAARLAQTVEGGTAPADAVAVLLDDPRACRHPYYGTVVT